MNTWQIERSEFKESQRLICKSALWLLAVSSDDELLEWTIHLHREELQIRCPKHQKHKLNQKKQKVTFKHYQMLKTLAQTYPQTWDRMSDIEMLTLAVGSGKGIGMQCRERHWRDCGSDLFPILAFVFKFIFDF